MQSQVILIFTLECRKIVDGLATRRADCRHSVAFLAAFEDPLDIPEAFAERRKAITPGSHMSAPVNLRSTTAGEHADLTFHARWLSPSLLRIHVVVVEALAESRKREVLISS